MEVSTATISSCTVMSLIVRQQAVALLGMHGMMEDSIDMDNVLCLLYDRLSDEYTGTDRETFLFDLCMI